MKIQLAEIIRVTKGYYVEHGAYDVFRHLILPARFFLPRTILATVGRRTMREFFGKLRSILDEDDYAAIGQVDSLNTVEPVSILAHFLAKNDFATCYYRIKCVTWKKRLLRSAFRTVPASVRLKAVATALLPDQVKRAVVRLLT